ncbi:hypothetical protein [Moumouvirus maliensis]|nr:hypothetical protein [Moumouvirus maliensis]
MSNMPKSDCYYVAEARPRPKFYWTTYNNPNYNRINNFNEYGYINNNRGYVREYTTDNNNNKILHGNISGQFALGPLASGPFTMNN